MLKEILTILISVATITGLIVWFIREYIKKIFNADAERLKQKLNIENQKYTKLQNEQFESLKLIYSNLNKTEELVNQFYHIIKDDIDFTKEHKERVVEPLTSLIFYTQSHFKENKIFVPKILVPKIEKVIDALFYCLTKSSLALLIKSDEFYDNDGNYLGLVSKKFSNISEDAKKEFYIILKLIEDTKNIQLPELILDIEVEFRIVFGSK